MQKRTVSGVSPLDTDHTKKKPPVMGGTQLQAAVRVNRSPEACYRYWRDFKNLPHLMRHLQSVEVLDDRRSHWIMDAPADTTIEWDAEIIEDQPSERISWRSLENAQVDNAGSVQFVPLDGGSATEIKVVLTYNPALGPIGNMVAGLFGESANQHLADDLKRFKETLEKEH